ncbi:MAG: ExeA family protein, partial [Gammaproteobacteria bacterium]
MYEQFFGFTEKPFSLNPDPSFLYLGKGHARALSMLEFGLASETGLTVVTGEIGAGKTTLLRYVLEQLDDDDYTVGLITNTHAAFGDLIHWVASAYGLEHAGKSKVTLYEDFVDFLISEYGEGRRVVLMVDEAQNLDAESLEELRILSNINADKDILLQIVVSGQPELRKTLRRPSLKQFVQRVTSYHHLKPLTLADTREYINHRLKVAGIDVAMFDPAAVLLI